MDFRPSTRSSTTSQQRGAVGREKPKNKSGEPYKRFKVKVIETNMIIIIYLYAMHIYKYRHAKFECHSLNSVRDVTIKLQYNVNFETQL